MLSMDKYKYSRYERVAKACDEEETIEGCVIDEFLSDFPEVIVEIGYEPLGSHIQDRAYRYYIIYLNDKYYRFFETSILGCDETWFDNQEAEEVVHSDIMIKVWEAL